LRAISATGNSAASHGLSVTTPNHLKMLLVVLQNDCRVVHLHLPHYGRLRLGLEVPVGSSLLGKFVTSIFVPTSVVVAHARIR